MTQLAEDIDKRMAKIMAVQGAENDEEQERLEDAARVKNIRAVLGPPGTGKTAVVNAKIRKWKAKGARILLALPTGQLASRMRAVHPDVDVDTCAGALLFHKELTEALPILTQYDMVVIDEISMLSKGNWDRIVAMWLAADRQVCLVCLGDFWQLPGPQKPPSNVMDSAGWGAWARSIEFHEVFRCKDQKLADKLAVLRTSVPSKKVFRAICSEAHRAWKTQEPTDWDVLELMRVTDEKTTIATCTRRGAATVNALALKVLFVDRKKKELTAIPFDWDTNMENFDAAGDVVSDRAPQAERTPVYAGMRVFLTKNLNKRDDFVNGMQATVEDFDAGSRCLRVLTASGKRLSVFPVTETVGKYKVTFYPLRIGYAGTVQRIQGMTLEHVTVYLDAPGCRAAAYVALSRVEYDHQYLIAGDVHPRHFVPAH